MSYATAGTTTPVGNGDSHLILIQAQGALVSTTGFFLSRKLEYDSPECRLRRKSLSMRPTVRRTPPNETMAKDISN